jgi:hypothetical protein
MICRTNNIIGKHILRLVPLRENILASLAGHLNALDDRLKLPSCVTIDDIEKPRFHPREMNIGKVNRKFRGGFKSRKDILGGENFGLSNAFRHEANKSDGNPKFITDSNLLNEINRKVIMKVELLVLQMSN